MIRAAVAYADGEGQPPPELQKVLKWRAWGVLPRGGGIDDQRHGELERMLACANAYDVWKMYQDGNLIKMTPAQTKMLQGLQKLNGK